MTLKPEYLVKDETESPLGVLNDCSIFWINKYKTDEGTVYYEFNNLHTEASEAPLQMTQERFHKLIAELQQLETEEPEEEEV